MQSLEATCLPSTPSPTISPASAPSAPLAPPLRRPRTTPPLSALLNSAGQSLNPAVLFSTQLRDTGAGLPDGGLFPQPKRQRRNAAPDLPQNPERGVVEIKPADYNLDTLAASPQTLRYLRQYGLVLITNLRQFRLLDLDSAGSVRTLERFTLADTPADLWQAPLSKFARHHQSLPDFLARVMLYRAPLVQPKDVAWLLASYAREARARAEDHPLASFSAVKSALQESLGIRFEGEKGEHFFRSTLVQTLFYGIFSAWVLWRRSPEGRAPGAQFDWRVAAHYLRVPVLRKLFGEMADPGALNSIQLQEVLNLAGEALNRVQPAFFDTFREEEAVAYFYEPFLEAFDPQLRKDLGVWYTPKEIVEYMVARVDHLLRSQLHQPLGLASPAVRILDPCCGTGAYLTAVLHRIHSTLLEQAGDDTALVPHALREAALTRVFGFEIMPAPFVIAHLQIASLLEAAHAPLTDNHRAGVFLTNALTGWVPERHPQSAIFKEFEKEREDSEQIKQQGTILVILGNPPYNGYAGIAQIDEERDLTTAYREQIPGLPAPQGQGLNDLYVRFFRIAERRIVGDAHVQGNQGGCGIVCLISNNAWLFGSSHTSMRHHYLQAFQKIYIDNLNGDKYRTGKTTPDGKPDPSAFSTPQNREGIQVGTAITTLVRTSAALPHSSERSASLKGHDFTDQSEELGTRGLVSGHDFTDQNEDLRTRGLVTRARLQPGQQNAKINGASAPAESPHVGESLKGHDFSRADNASQKSGALAPEASSSANPMKGTGVGEGYGLQPVHTPSKMSRALAPEGMKNPAAPPNRIHLRDLWGTAKLAQLQTESRNQAEPTYTPLAPAPALGNPLAHRTHSVAYTSWPRLPELFPVSFPGIKTSRDPLVVDIDRERLIERIGFYLDSKNSDEMIANEIPIAMTNSAGFAAKETRRELLERRAAELLLSIENGNLTEIDTEQKNFARRQTETYCYRPFDIRWIYYEMHTRLLDRPREDYWRALTGSRISMISAQSNRRDFDPPCVSSSLASLHVVEKGTSIFPLEVFEESLFDTEKPDRTYDNVSSASTALYPPNTNPRDIFFHSLAVMHSRQYRTENAGALLGDWPRIPLPATADQLAHSAALGRRLAELLDAESTINLAAEWSFLAALKLPLNPNLDEALKITAGWGHKGQGSTVMPGRGLAPERPWTQAEREKLAALGVTQSTTNLGAPGSGSPRTGLRPWGGDLSHLETGEAYLQSPQGTGETPIDTALTLLGETCVDVYLNGNAHWSAVPIHVWNYTLGGYQVLKKWLSYREFTPEPASPLLHRALRPDEAAYFAQVVRRIAAILLLGPALDASYKAILPTATGLNR